MSAAKIPDIPDIPDGHSLIVHTAAKSRWFVGPLSPAVREWVAEIIAENTVVFEIINTRERIDFLNEVGVSIEQVEP
jgi:hypothetical protein